MANANVFDKLTVGDTYVEASLFVSADGATVDEDKLNAVLAAALKAAANTVVDVPAVEDNAQA